MRNKLEIPRVIAIVFALVLLAFSLYTLAAKLMEYKKSDETFDEMREAVQVKEPEEIPVEIEPEEEEENLVEPLNAEEAHVEGPMLDIDWTTFANTDCIGWLVLDDISYPVMHAEDNNKYLHALPDGTYNYGGSLFLYADNMPDLTDRNSFIYGHNMANGSMFGKLKRYKSAEYANHMFYLFTPDGYRHTYQFFAVANIEEGTKTYTYSFGSIADLMEYQRYMKQISLYATGPEPSEKGRLVSLSACDGFEGTRRRLVVQGIEVERVKVQKPASWWEGVVQAAKVRREEARLMQENISGMANQAGR